MDLPPGTLRLGIDLGERSYPVLIGRGLLEARGTWDGLPRATCAVIVSNSKVAPLYAGRLRRALQDSFSRSFLIELADGEEHKDWSSLDIIFDRLIEAGCDRKTVLFALGGGVVGDVTGFAAACFMRGVPFVQVPTTLLAQVDSSVGGKTAINHPRGKNLIGAFHQPVRVVADLETLDTLPQREVRAGLAEVIKYGPIADASFFEWVERNVDKLLAGDGAALAHAVRRSCEIKATIVATDEPRESGLRETLNFGHTFGHAIEAAMGYGAWLHGEAVGCGMVMAADLSARLGTVSAGDAERVAALVERAGLPRRGPALPAERLLALMRSDKKALGGAIRFVVLNGFGRAAVRPVPESAILDVLRMHLAPVGDA